MTEGPWVWPKGYEKVLTGSDDTGLESQLLRRLRQEDQKPCLDYRVSLRAAWADLDSNGEKGWV